MKQLDLSQFDLSYIEEEAAEKQQFYWVGLYYFFAKAAIEMYGEKGEEALRKGVRAYGKERGQRMRRIADSKGLPANLLTLFDYYDLMSDPRFVHPSEGLVITEEVKKSITGRCPDAEMWGRLPDGMHIGSIYCEEVHHQIYSGFDPAIQVNLCETLTNGGSFCRFHLYCRKCNQKEYPLPQYIPQIWDDFSGDMVASIHSIFCIMYFKIGRILKDELGEDAVREALEEFCYYRGARMRKLHQDKELPVNLHSFLLEGDLFLDHREQLSVREKSESEIEIVTKRNILYEVAKTYACEDLYELYQEISYSSLSRGYGEKFCYELPAGNPREEIHMVWKDCAHGND
ncbi:MAG: L-2-amino-thiazoline-4-carboxylic acid hydrolase [Clostridiales bacterium]|nr:L-2-amino-thiazoline-4-carboxylic acid hydrolase [Clostridiales bacterium]